MPTMLSDAKIQSLVLVPIRTIRNSMKPYIGIRQVNERTSTLLLIVKTSVAPHTSPTTATLTTTPHTRSGGSGRGRGAGDRRRWNFRGGGGYGLTI